MLNNRAMEERRMIFGDIKPEKLQAAKRIAPMFDQQVYDVSKGYATRLHPKRPQNLSPRQWKIARRKAKNIIKQTIDNARASE